MATSVLKILLSLIVLVSFHGFKVDCKSSKMDFLEANRGTIGEFVKDNQVERYAFNIVENGASFNEEVEVDVDSQTEVIRVPKHNSVDAMDVMNDFDAGLSVRRVPLTKDCYVSKLDSSFPSPEKMRRGMEQASRQSLPDKVKTERTMLRVLGFADRLALPQKFLDFCGSFPIYKVEEISLDSMNTSMIQAQGQGRRKRSHYWSDWTGCGKSDVATMIDCFNKYGLHGIRFSCKYQTTYGYYYTTCSVWNLGPGYYCYLIVHRYNYVGVCCTPYC